MAEASAGPQSAAAADLSRGLRHWQVVLGVTAAGLILGYIGLNAYLSHHDRGGLPDALPGERAPVHAHSICAVRFGLAGSGARMIIDGDRVPMEPGDLILTPSWSWHQLTASDRELVLLRLTDRPIHDAFGLFQAEEEA
jgi:gentisate 1,2-dioxygenase